MKKLLILFITLVFCVSTITGCSSSSANTSPTWTSSKDPDSSHSPLAYVWGSSSSDVFAVGDGGTIIHYNGKSWSKMSSGTTNDLIGVWGSSSSDVFAVGDQGTILHYNGQTWSQMVSGTTVDIGCVWGTSPSDVFVLTNSDIIGHYDGNVWSSMTGSAAAFMVGIWGVPRPMFSLLASRALSCITTVIHGAV